MTVLPSPVAFQSTPPVKAATLLCFIGIARRIISIHAAREGGDQLRFRPAQRDLGFQSTPPVKAATSFVLHSRTSATFQSTPPVKAATINPRCVHGLSLFQSTPPVKAATCRAPHGKSSSTFQSTPPVKAATADRLRIRVDYTHFNPRRP